MPVAAAVQEPALVEGGDTLWLDDSTLLVGIGYRTNEPAIAALESAFAGTTVVAFDLPHWNGDGEVLHLLSFISPLDRDLALVWPRLAPVRLLRLLAEREIRIVEVPDDELASQGPNVLALGPRLALALEGNPETRRRMEQAGVDVVVQGRRDLAQGRRRADVSDATAAQSVSARRYVPFDPASVRRPSGSPCFICEIVSGADSHHHVWYEDDVAIAFLNRYPRLLGYSLVAPKRHLEAVIGDFAIDEYLALQRAVYRVGEALRQVVPTERLYILSLGSQQANAHVHWHVAPLPSGVPFEEQQFAALDRPAVLAVTEAEQVRLAQALRRAVSAPRR